MNYQNTQITLIHNTYYLRFCLLKFFFAILNLLFRFLTCDGSDINPSNSSLFLFLLRLDDDAFN
jgi:hypothetical protein